MLFAVCATKSGNGRNVRIMKLLRFRHLRRAIFILWIICFWKKVQKKDRNDIGTISEVLKRLQEIYVYSTSENAEYSYLDETRLFNEGKLAIYVNGVWGASMISENINAKYALLPTTSGKKLSCESACFGYVLGKSGNEQKEEASIRF